MRRIEKREITVRFARLAERGDWHRRVRRSRRDASKAELIWRLRCQINIVRKVHNSICQWIVSSRDSTLVSCRCFFATQSATGQRYKLNEKWSPKMPWTSSNVASVVRVSFGKCHFRIILRMSMQPLWLVHQLLFIQFEIQFIYCCCRCRICEMRIMNLFAKYSSKRNAM